MKYVRQAYKALGEKIRISRLQIFELDCPCKINQLTSKLKLLGVKNKLISKYQNIEKAPQASLKKFLI